MGGARRLRRRGPTKAEIEEWGNAAIELDAYLRFRASQEGVGYGLSPGWLLGALCHGCRSFFGIIVGAAGIERDEQNPEALSAWRATQ